MTRVPRARFARAAKAWHAPCRRPCSGICGARGAPLLGAAALLDPLRAGHGSRHAPRRARPGRAPRHRAAPAGAAPGGGAPRRRSRQRKKKSDSASGATMPTVVCGSCPRHGLPADRPSWSSSPWSSARWSPAWREHARASGPSTGRRPPRAGARARSRGAQCHAFIAAPKAPPPARRPGAGRAVRGDRGHAGAPARRGPQMPALFRTARVQALQRPRVRARSLRPRRFDIAPRVMSNGAPKARRGGGRRAPRTRRGRA